MKEYEPYVQSRIIAAKRLSKIPISKVPLIPKRGIKNTPAKITPATVPTVFTEKIFPTEKPIFLFELERISDAIGSAIPMNKVGMTIMEKLMANSSPMKSPKDSDVRVKNEDVRQKI